MEAGTGKRRKGISPAASKTVNIALACLPLSAREGIPEPVHASPLS